MSKTAREVIFEYADGFNYSDKPTSAIEPDLLIEQLDAAGFVIVPKEPTDAMKEAALEVYYSGKVWPKDIVTAYRAMIAAASEPRK